MKIVLDTNVLVSGLLAPFGPSGKIVRMVSAGELILCLDARIISEYQDVLHRPNVKFDKDHISNLVDFVKRYGQFCVEFATQEPFARSRDEPFLEVAIAGIVRSLITVNVAYNPHLSREGIEIFSPSEFLEFFKQQNRNTEQDA